MNTKVIFTLVLFSVLFAPARANAREALQHPVLPDSVKVLDSLAQHYEDIAYYADALRCLEQIENPSIPQQQRKAKMRYLRRQHRSSISLLDSLLQQNDSTFMTLRLMALNYEPLQKPDSAIVFRKCIVDKYPFNANNLLQLYENYKIINEVERCLTPLNDYLYQFDDNNIRLVRAMAYLELRDDYSAFNDFRHLYQKGDRNISTMYNYGRILLDRDSLQLADRILTEALDSCSYSLPHVLIEEARALIALKKDSAVPDLLLAADSILTRNPQILYYSYLIDRYRGDYFYQNKRYSSADASYRAALQYEPNSSRLLYKMALLQKDKNDDVKEMIYLNRFLKVTEDILHPAIMLREQRRYAEKRMTQLKEKAFMTKASGSPADKGEDSN